MKKIVVASQNPVKINTTKLGFEQMMPGEEFEMIGVKADSGVSDQPMSDQETLTGAKNRIKHAKELHPGADFYVGLEGGVEPDHENRVLHEFAWIAIEDANGRYGESQTATFSAPEAIYKLVVEEGMEVGHASDQVFKEDNSKQKMGIIGLLTNGVIDRTEYYRHAVVCALVPVLREDLY